MVHSQLSPPEWRRLLKLLIQCWLCVTVIQTNIFEKQTVDTICLQFAFQKWTLIDLSMCINDCVCVSVVDCVYIYCCVTKSHWETTRLVTVNVCLSDGWCLYLWVCGWVWIPANVTQDQTSPQCQYKAHCAWWVICHVSLLKSVFFFIRVFDVLIISWSHYFVVGLLMIKIFLIENQTKIKPSMTKQPI